MLVTEVRCANDNCEDGHPPRSNKAVIQMLKASKIPSKFRPAFSFRRGSYYDLPPSKYIALPSKRSIGIHTLLIIL
jgi:hypothetical protein